MSALYVKCPQCGPLLSFIPQGNEFEIDIKCLCGSRIAHKENGNNPTSQALQEKINSLKGKHTVQRNETFNNNEQDEIVNSQCRLPGG